jgi:hypothetical protein
MMAARQPDPDRGKKVLKVPETHEAQPDDAEAIRIMSSGLGRAELELATSFAMPLYWIYREAAGFRVRNGTAFFLDTGRAIFGVTAHHVIAQMRRDRVHHDVLMTQISTGPGLTIDFEGANSILDEDEAIDIATFRIEPEQIERSGKTALRGHQPGWPPGPPQQDRGVYYSGYPETETLWQAPDEVNFGAVPGSGVASSVNEHTISTQIARERLFAVLGRGLPPADYNFNGMSGGPMLTVVQGALRSWRLAGVIYEGPNIESTAERPGIEGLEIIRARRADFINADGTLDRNRLL